ncbi:2-oxoacid dehydrogenases acyltransferase-domain-containing protein [Cladochytrium replicatum]|nr:2-oxoacid dehydrogenases acyltransferase-domain-containing protein [Cladochytrium replicatum]
MNLTRTLPGAAFRFTRRRISQSIHATSAVIPSISGIPCIHRIPQDSHVFPHSAPLLSGFRKFTTSTTRQKILPFLLADIGEGTTEVEIIQWFVKPGDVVAQFDKLCEVQSDKAADNITSRFDGIVRKLHYKAGDMAIVGKPLVDIEVEGSEPASHAPAPQSLASAAPAKPQQSTTPKEAISADREKVDDILTTPAVRRIARERGIDLALVKGTGKGGRIMKEDVLNHSEISKASPTPVPSLAAKASKQPAGADTLVPLSPIQKAMFKSMTRSLAIPHFGFSDEVILDKLAAARESINAQLKIDPQDGLSKITYMPFFIKALSLALEKYHLLNALVVEEEGKGPQLLYRAQHNVGMAMDTPNGLVVPSIKNVQSLTILDIAREIERLKVLGAKGALTSSELTGGTITLSNIGNIGGSYLHPVCVTSEVCIGAIGAIKRVPQFQGDSDRVVARKVVAVSWNADHRVVDGATMARFVGVWRRYLEKPELMLTVLS